MSITFLAETTGFHHGQRESSIVARDTSGVVIGFVDYSVFAGSCHIRMIEVFKDRRREGIASRLLDRLEEEEGGKPVGFGMATAEGAALRQHWTAGKACRQLAHLDA